MKTKCKNRRSHEWGNWTAPEKVTVNHRGSMNKFRDELTEIINRQSMENGSNTPDFILAEYLTDCLATFDKAVQRRAAWYGVDREQQIDITSVSEQSLGVLALTIHLVFAKGLDKVTTDEIARVYNSGLCSTEPEMPMLSPTGVGKILHSVFGFTLTGIGRPQRDAFISYSEEDNERLKYYENELSKIER